MFRGLDLLAFDETGTSDPYVLLRIGSIQHQTDVIYHSLAPTWNENFLFSINSLDKDLHLTVVDKDPEFDDLMANYRIHLSKIPLQVRMNEPSSHELFSENEHVANLKTSFYSIS